MGADDRPTAPWLTTRRLLRILTKQSSSLRSSPSAKQVSPTGRLAVPLPMLDTPRDQAAVGTPTKYGGSHSGPVSNDGCGYARKAFWPHFVCGNDSRPPPSIGRKR